MNVGTIERSGLGRGAVWALVWSLLVLAPAAVEAGEPMLGRPAGMVSATYQRWTWPDLSGLGEHRLTEPAQVLLLGDWSRIAARDVRVSVMARADRDLQEDGSGEVDLLFGYLEAMGVGGVLDVRAGRRILLDGSIMGGALDGLWLDTRSIPWVGLGIHGGRLVALADEPVPTYSFGARAWLQGVRSVHAEVRYERQEDSPLSMPVRSRVGADLVYSRLDDWYGFATLDHELRTGTLERARAGLRYRPPGAWRFGAEAFWYDPVFDPESVFARMQSDPHWGFRLRGDTRVSKGLDLYLRWTTRVFKRIELGRDGGQDMLMPDPSHGLDLGAAGRPWRGGTVDGSAGTIHGSQGTYLLAHLSVGQTYRPLGLTARAGGYVNAHDRRYGDPSGILELFGSTGAGIERDLATGGWFELTCEPWSALAISARAELYRDESAFRATRLLARVTGRLF